jgi:CubicO group peptidase (beta-lactamase class C family)
VLGADDFVFHESTMTMNECLGRAVSLLLVGLVGCGPRVRTAAAVQSSSEKERGFSTAPARAYPVEAAKLKALAPRLDEYFRSRLETNHATGLAVGIVLGGELVYAKGFGIRDEKSKAPRHR